MTYSREPRVDPIIGHDEATWMVCGDLRGPPSPSYRSASMTAQSSSITVLIRQVNHTSRPARCGLTVATQVLSNSYQQALRSLDNGPVFHRRTSVSFLSTTPNVTATSQLHYYMETVQHFTSCYTCSGQHVSKTLPKGMSIPPSQKRSLEACQKNSARRPLKVGSSDGH